MPNFPTLYSAYRNAQTPLSLRDFSRLGNFLTNSNQFDSGDSSTFGELAKKGSYWIDQGFEATGAPQWAGQKIGDLFDLFGADRAKGEEIGQDLPRTFATWAPAIASGPLGLGSKVALSIPAALGAAEAYEKTDSGLSAATAAAMPYVGSFAGDFAASQAAKALGWAEKDLAESAAKRVGTYIASQVGAIAGLEGVNTAVSGQAPDVTSKEYWLGLAAQQIPFAAFDAKRIFTKPKYAVPTPEVKKFLRVFNIEPTSEAPALLALPENSTHPEVLAEAQLRIERSRQAALASVEPITNEVAKTEAIVAINKSHDELAQGLGLQNKPESEAPEKLVGAKQQTFPGERQAKAFADSLAKTHDTQIVFNPKTNSHRVYYRKKPVIALLPEAPVVDVSAEPEKVIEAADAVGKKPDLMQEFLEVSKTEVDPARAAEIATNKVLSEAAVVPTEEVKNRGGRPSKSNQVEELFFRLAGDEHADPRDAEFSKAMIETRLDREVQNNSNAVTESQANKGMRELALGYQAWKDGAKWRGADMSKMSAKSAAEFIKIHVKAGNKRVPTVGSKELSVEDRVARQDEEFFDSIKAAEEELSSLMDEDEAADLITGKDIIKAKTAPDAEKVKQTSAKTQEAATDTSEEINNFALRFGQELDASGKGSPIAANLAWLEWRKNNKISADELTALRKILGIKETQNPGAAMLKYYLEHPMHKELPPEQIVAKRVIRGNDGSEIRIAGGGFVYSLQGYDAMTNKLGKHTLPKDGWITEGQLKTMGAKDKMLKNEEIELYKTIVPEAFKDGKVNVPALDRGLQSNLAVAVHTYGQKAEEDNSYKARFDQIRGQLDLLGIHTNVQFGPDGYEIDSFTNRAGEYVNQNEPGITAEQSRLMDDIIALGYQGMEPSASGPRATAYYDQIALLDTSKHPVQRIDVVIPSKQSSTGFGLDSKSVLWAPDQLHENLPNTLGWAMVQTTKHPLTGEPVMLVAEVQSRWAQERSRYLIVESSERPGTFDVWYKKPGGGKTRVSISELSKESAQRFIDSKVPPHSLLPLHQELILKAVIREAQKQGIKKIALSDAETAMMTEGHDIGHGPVPRMVEEVHAPKELQDYDQIDAWLKNKEAELKLKYPAPRYEVRSEDWIQVFDKQDAPISRPSQEGGMRLAYDITLPSIMSKLVGTPLGFVVYHGSAWGGHVKWQPHDMQHFGTEEQAANRIKRSLSFEPDIIEAWPEDHLGNLLEPKPKIEKVRIKGKFKRVEDVSDDYKWHRISQEAREEGYDGLVYKNEWEGAGDSYLVFDKKNVLPFLAQGQIEDFGVHKNSGETGSPVFRNPDNTPKTNITARVYDITAPSGELSRFNQGGTALSFGLGTKLEGLAPTFETMFYRLSRKAGIPDKEAAVMLPSFRKFVDAVGMKDVEFGELVRDSLVNGRDIKGMATTMGEKTRRMWLAGMEADKGNASWARMMMTLIAHENGHLVDHLYNSGQMVSARARKAYENMLKWKNTASAEEISDTLKLSAEMLLPKEWQKLPEMQELLSTKDGTEALATLHGIFALSSHAKGFDAEIGMALLPAGPRGFFRTLAEYGRSFTRVLKNLWFFGGKTEKALQIRELQENFKQMQKGVQTASENLVKLQKLMSYDPSDYTQIKLSALEVLQNRSAPSDVKQIARSAAFDGEKNPEDSQLLNAPKGFLGWLMRGISYFLEPIDSLTARVPKFAQVGNAILQTPATAKRYVGEFLEPLYGERDPITKQVSAGSKEQQEMVRLWNEDAGVNQAINLIEYTQNKNRKALDLTKPEGDVAKALNGLTPEKRNAALAFVEKKKVATRVVQRRVLEAVDKVSALQLAEKIGSTRPDLYDQSEAIARNIKDAVELSKSEKAEDKLLAQSLMQEAQATVGNDRLFALYSSMAEKQLVASAKLKTFFAGKDWFHSYVRVGAWAIDAWDKSGKQVYHTLPARTNAEAVALEKQLRADGLKTNIKKLTKGKFVKVDEEMQAMLENVDDRLKRSFMDEFSAQVDPVKLEEFFQKNSFASTLKHQVEVAERFAPTKAGRNLKGAKDLDVVAMELEQAGLMANTLAKMESGAKLSHAKADPKLKAPDMQHWMQQFDAAWEQYHVPDNELASKVSKAISVYSLGMNVGNMVAEGFQPMTTIMTEAIANGKGLGVLKLTKMMMGVMKDTAAYYAGGTKKKLAQGEEFNAWKDSGERKMLDTLAEEGAMHNGSYTEAFNAEDQSMLSWKLKSRSGGNWASSLTRKLGDYSMQMYQLFSRHNSRLTALMGYRMAKAHGMDHEAAVDFTRRFVERAALTSTRAVRPVGAFAENTRALGQLASVMQRYNLGWLAMAARHIQRGWLLSDAKAAGRGFDQVSKSDARKATMYMLGSQLAAAGALGLPFVGALSKVYQQLTGKALKADAYQMLSETLDEDASESGFISDGLMRGFGNALLNKAGVPIDLGSRFAIGGLPGMSEYSGFDAGSVFGPTGGMIKTIATGVEAAAKDGDYMRAGKTLMPPGLRKLFDLAVSGDMTDNNSNRMGLTSQEKFLYGLGFTPDRIRKLRDFEQMSQNITANRRQSQDKVEAEIADMVRTNPAEAQAKLISEAQKLGITPKELASGVAQRVVKATMPKDFRDTIPALDARQAISLMRGLGTDFGQPLETQKAQLQNTTLSRLGVAPDLRSMMRAQFADNRLTAEPYLPMKVASNRRPSSRGLTAEQLAMLAGR